MKGAFRRAAVAAFVAGRKQVTGTALGGFVAAVDVICFTVCMVVRRRPAALFVAVVSVGVWVLRLVLRDVIDRPRPIDPLWPVDHFSFPSGHTANAAAAALAVVVTCWPFLGLAGRIAVAAGNNGLFRALCAAIGREDLSEDERFATNAARVEHRRELIPELQAVLRERPADDWVELDPAAWPARREVHYRVLPTICFNCEAACGLLAFVDKRTGEIAKFEGNPVHPGSRGRTCAACFGSCWGAALL